MAQRARRPRITAQAWRKWEVDSLPILLSEAVDALLVLPDGEFVDSILMHAPVVLVLRKGTLFGTRLAMLATKGPDGRWIDVVWLVPAERLEG